MSAAIGQSIPRVDGRAKVTGAGRYSAEIALDNMAYAVLVGAHVSSGRISDINTSEAEQAKGVLAVLTYHNLGRVAAQPPLLPSLVGQAAPGETFFPLQDEVVHYAGQPVAIVIAESLERAQHAATLLRISDEETPSTTILDQGRDHAYEHERIFGGLSPGRQQRGDVEAGLAGADVRIDVTYRFAANHHNPIEPSATTAVWDGDRLTLYDSTQGITATQLTVAALLGLSPSKVGVITHFIGCGFGCKAMIWPHVTLAALAARHIGRPVKLALSREQMFSSCGHREEQQQLVEQGLEGMLPARSRALRLAGAQPGPPFAARRELVNRLRHGDGRLSGGSVYANPVRACAPVRRRQRRHWGGHAGFRDGHGDGDDAGCRGRARHPARPRPLRVRRHRSAHHIGRRWLGGRGHGECRGPRRRHRVT